MKYDSATVIACLVVLLAMLFIGPLFIMWAWNAVIPAIFGLTTITYWQAFGLDILCSFLFGGKHVSANKD